MSSKATKQARGRAIKVLPFPLAARKKNKNAGVAHMGSKRAEVVPIEHKPSNKCRVRIDDLYTFAPMTINQERFYDLYREQTPATLLHGVAGTGKSFIALYKALEEVLDPSNPFSKVVIVRSAVQGRDIGALPGDIEEKTDMFQAPYIEICNELFGPRKQAYERLVEQGNIEFITTSFLRGITIKNAILLVDEAQNLNWQEISSIMTRAGTHAKIIFCGDFRQTDLSKKNDLSGLKKFIAISRMMPSFRNVEFGVDDIVRSDIVKEFVMAMMRYDDTNDITSRSHESH